jgi:hypothetical protein
VVRIGAGPLVGPLEPVLIEEGEDI